MTDTIVSRSNNIIASALTPGSHKCMTEEPEHISILFALFADIHVLKYDEY